MSRDQAAFGMTASGLSRHWLMAVFAAAYFAILCAQLNHGLASGDAHGIVGTVQLLVEKGQVDVSRPPGHPTTEFYLFGAIAWIARSFFHVRFDDQIYLACQAIAAIATLVVFYELILRIGISRLAALLAAISLEFSFQFVANAFDGEEFVFGLFFFLVSLRLLIMPADKTSFLRLLLSIFCFALATGCRPEIVFGAIIFPFYCLLHPRLGWKYVLPTIAFLAVAGLLVWLPVLLTGLRPPYPVGMNLRQSLIGGFYRIVFQCFTLPVFLLFGWTWVRSVVGWREQIQKAFPDNFLFLISSIVPIIFASILFLHAEKAGHVLVAVPLLILLAARRSIVLLATIAVVTFAGSLLTIDIFKDRHLVGPILAPGSYFQTIHKKPYYRLPYLEKAIAQCGDQPEAIIVDARPWDFEFQMQRGAFRGVEVTHPGKIKQVIFAFHPQQHPECSLLQPEAAYENSLLREFQGKGCAMKMDETVYRTLFQRYDVTSRRQQNSATIEGINFDLFRIE